MVIDDFVIRQAVVLSERYINDRFPLPDKAIDMLDEACAAAALRNKHAERYSKLMARIFELKQAEEEELGRKTSTMKSWHSPGRSF